MAVKNRRKNKKFVEIYFILYLAALVLLLPDFKNNDTIESFEGRAEDVPFQIQTEKSILFCKAIRDSIGFKIVEMDSINNIYFRGDVEDINFQFIIEDQIRRDKVKLSLDSINSTKVFRIEENLKNQYVSFIWNPSKFERLNKSYIVKVIAKGKYKTNNKVLEASVNTQFTLNLVFTDEIPNYASNLSNPNAISNESQNQSFITPIEVISNNTQIDARPLQANIKSLALLNWTNMIYISGMNPKDGLLKSPELSIIPDYSNSGGSVFISKYYDNAIELSGKTPSFGKMKVKMKLIRKSDRNAIETEFIVEPTQVGKPEFSSVMYPEMRYTIKPKMPILSNQKITVLIKDGKEVIKSTQEGIDFDFIPNIQDTGKTLYLERYVDNDLFDQRYAINVRSYPNPEIIDIIRNGDTILIKTKAFGYINGQKNYVKRLDFDISSVNERELIGRTREESNYIYFQTFAIIIPYKSNTKFSVKAIDRREYSSKTLKYP